MKQSIVEIKLRCYVACGWGLVLAFVLMGILMKRSESIFMDIIVVVMWTTWRIIQEALDAIRTLGQLRRAEKKPDDQDPPGT